MQLHLLTLLAAAAPLVFADVEFTSPVPGAELTGGTSITVEWQDSGAAPSISDLTTYQLFLCAGGNRDTGSATGDVIQLTALTTQGTFATGNQAVGTIPIGVGADQTNAYFLKMISVSSVGGTVTNYSPRFSLSGMTGTFPEYVLAGLAALPAGTTDGPPSVNAVANNPAAGGGAAEPAQYAVPYSMQTGLTKYAPMQPVPGTKITMKSNTPLFPTSAVVLAATFLPIPSQVTTMTLSQTFSVSQIENTVAAAPMPSDDMQKFLNRWKD